MNLKAVTRRRFLGLSAAGSLIGASGCLSNSDDFEFPDGFSEDGVQDYAFGIGSPMYELDSVGGDYLDLQVDDEVEIELETTFEVNRVEHQYYGMRTAPFMEEIEHVESYFVDNILYERIRFEDGREEYRRHENPEAFHDFTHRFRNLANLDIIENWAEGVTFELAEINATIQPKQAVYHANTQGMEGTPFIQRRVDRDGSFVDGEMSFVIDDNGMFHSFWALAEFEQATRGNEIEYQNFNNVTISEPEWLADARDAA